MTYSSNFVSSFDMILQPGIISEFSTTVFNRTDKFFFRHIIQQHVDKRSRLLNRCYLCSLVIILLIDHNSVTVRAQVHQACLNFR